MHQILTWCVLKTHGRFLHSEPSKCHIATLRIIGAYTQPHPKWGVIHGRFLHSTEKPPCSGLHGKYSVYTFNTCKPGMTRKGPEFHAPLLEAPLRTFSFS